jgi:hypothetical protein
MSMIRPSPKDNIDVTSEVGKNIPKRADAMPTPNNTRNGVLPDMNAFQIIGGGRKVRQYAYKAYPRDDNH